jgi:hypothetical protein
METMMSSIHSRIFKRMLVIGRTLMVINTIKNGLRVGRRMATQLCWNRLALCAVLAGFSVVYVQPVAAQSNAELREAKKLYQSGKKQYRADNYEDALDLFRESFELSKRPELLYNIGLSYRSLGQLSEAVIYFQRYLEESPEAKNADGVVEVIIDLQEQIASEMGSLSIQSAIDGRMVFLGDEEDSRCKTPCTLQLPPGEHLIRVRDSTRDEEEERLVELRPSEMAAIEVELRKEDVSGYLTVRSTEPGPTVSVGEDRSPVAMLKSILLTPGPHDLHVDIGGEVSTHEIMIASDERTEVLIVPTSTLGGGEWDWWNVLGWGLVGVSGTSLFGATLLGLESQSTYDWLDRQNATGLLAPSHAVAQARDQQVMANGLFATAAIAGVGGAAVIVWRYLSSQ